MKKIIIITIIAVSFFSGCGNYNNSEATRIRTEWDTLQEQMAELVPIVEDWLKRKTQFEVGLTDEQLEAYIECCSASSGTGEIILKCRRLKKLLSEDQQSTFLALAEEKAYGWGPKAQYFVDRQQNLEKQWETARQNALYEYQQSQQRRIQNRGMLLQYYQRYQLQQSLSGIENAIRNQPHR